MLNVIKVHWQYPSLLADSVVCLAEEMTNPKQAATALPEKVTKLKPAEEKLQEKDENYRLIARNFPNGVVLLFDQNLRYTLAEGMGFKAADFPGELLEGKTLWEASPTNACKLLEPLYRKALAGEATTLEIPDGERIDLVHILPVTNQLGEISNGMVVTYDITQHKHLQKQLEKYALYEPLTNLPNKTWFLESLERQIKLAKAEQTGLFAVLFLELERFEMVKYSLGHQIADQLMVATAKRLERLLSLQQPVARVGDNTLGILLVDILEVREAAKIADRIQEQLMLP
ncbi:MAG: diguanylate cyclase, partial [Symploca sp. SIO2E6]|nr:diguanylate cyclase [Symploca sp. SIO2E6]